MKRLFLCLLMSSLAVAVHAQHSVDPSTGTLNVNLPLYSITDGSISVPGNLSYSASGVKVTQDGGWVGQNWNLSAQSYGVYREMRGLPDDYSGTSPDNRRGWLRNTNGLPTSIKNFTPSTDNNPSTCADEVANYTFLNGIDYNQDTEPDVFTVVAPGLSFDFYFDETKQPQVVPYQDVIITPNTTTGTITSFIVTDGDGVQYKFDELETLTTSAKSANPYVYIRKSNSLLTPITYHTAWKLTRVTSPVYGVIDFTYRQVSISDNNLTTKKEKINYQYPIVFYNSYTKENVLDTRYAYSTLEFNRSSIIKIPVKIISPTTEIQFTSNINDGTTIGRLSSITVNEKRTGVLIPTKTIQFTYDDINGRSILKTLSIKNGTASQTLLNYSFDYQLGNTILTQLFPKYDDSFKDDWGFYKLDPQNDISVYSAYSETSGRISLKKITLPSKGYLVFFYEVHDYWDGNNTIQGGGIRIRKIQTHDGISNANGITTEYEYKNLAGQSSGKLIDKSQYSLGCAYFNFFAYTDLNTGIRVFGPVRYQSYSGGSSLSTAQIKDIFTIKASEPFHNYNTLKGSAVVYERVIERKSNSGYSVYEYDLPATFGESSANSNEWEASQVWLARPSAPVCLELGAAQSGLNQYPYPPNPNYDFAQGLLKKVTHYREDGVKRQELAYEYQRIYGGSGIKKIFGLSMEELPTHYYNGSNYVDSKMFAFSKYTINTDVSTVLKKQTKIEYATDDPLKKITSSTEYFYGTGAHRFVERSLTINSDQTQVIQRFKYVKDYTIPNNADIPGTAIKNLQLAHRNNTVIETIYSQVKNGFEKFHQAKLTLHQTLNGKVYPQKVLEFTSPDGASSFQGSSITTNVFSYNSNYSLTKTILGVDNFGLPKESIGREKIPITNINAYGGSAPVVSIVNAKAAEFIYSDFETNTEVSFSTPWNPTLITGRGNSNAIQLPTGTSGPYFLIKGVTNASSQHYIFSCWLKPSTSGSLSIKLTGNVTATFNLPFSASSTWKYHSMSIPIPTTMTASGFSVEVKTTSPVVIDDVAFYPSQSTFKTYTYVFPFGPSLETDSQGNTAQYIYDEFGRLSLVYDRDGNIIQKSDYGVKP